jgi:CPA2 family monovalent cation:H+ antiporter-2
MPPEARDLIVAGAMVSILVNPLLFLALDRMAKPAAEPAPTPAPAPPPRAEPEPVLVVGFGRVGHRVVEGLTRAGRSVTVIDENEEKIAAVRESGIPAVTGAAAEVTLLDHIDLPATRWLVSTIPDPFEAGSLIEQARAANPTIRIVARARNDAEVEYLRSLGADRILVGEEQIALGMIHHILERPRP